MRRGFTLVEIVAATSVAMLVAAVAAGLFKMLVSDVPKVQRTLNANRAVNVLLEQIQKDVDAATALPDRAGAVAADDKTLLIELPGQVVCYRQEAGRVVRSGLAKGGERTLNEFHTPRAKVRWRLWKRGGANRAVEVSTGIEPRATGGTTLKLANAHVYFVGGFGRGRRMR